MSKKWLVSPEYLILHELYEVTTIIPSDIQAIQMHEIQNKLCRT
jgi:hypothetical protein